MPDINPNFESDEQSVADQRDRLWISRVQESDKQAFIEMFDFYAPKLSSFVCAQIHAPEIAEEIVQDLFLGIWMNRLVWEVPGPLKRYLYRAALNRVSNYRRSVKRENSLHIAVRDNYTRTNESGASPSGEAALVEKELEEAIRAAVSSLPARCREVWLLSREHHMTYAEIASVLSISIKTVELHMSRAFKILREKLQSWK